MTVWIEDVITIYVKDFPVDYEIKYPTLCLKARDLKLRIA